VLGDAVLPDLLGALNAVAGRVAPAVIGAALRASPGAAALVIGQPAAGRAHVYWLVADSGGRPGEVVLRWEDRQDPGAADRPVELTGDALDDVGGASLDDLHFWRVRQLYSPETQIAFFGPDGLPTTAEALLRGAPPAAPGAGASAAPGAGAGAGAGGRTADALLDPAPGPRRPGSLPAQPEAAQPEAAAVAQVAQARPSVQEQPAAAQMAVRARAVTLLGWLGEGHGLTVERAVRWS
jgi:hypothetical protein